uniref:RING-type domain-containing protein n=1 Tax=Salarias fasciatus TaxID=181472 RepID=A0A672JJE9_SALFA
MLLGVHREKKSSAGLSCCALCQNVLKDPVSWSCGYQVCRQCSSSHWNQGSSSAASCCRQCC